MTFRYWGLMYVNFNESDHCKLAYLPATVADGPTSVDYTDNLGSRKAQCDMAPVVQKTNYRIFFWPSSQSHINTSIDQPHFCHMFSTLTLPKFYFRYMLDMISRMMT